MHKIIIISESTLCLTIDQSSGQCTCHPSGLLLEVARECGSRYGLPVELITEIADDAPGEIIKKALKESNVATPGLDNTDCTLTPIEIADGQHRTTRYEAHDAEEFDPVWPSISKGDIVVFGGYYSIDPRVRPHLWQILEAAAELGAHIVYVPDIADSRVTRVTRIMPQVFENLEIAQTVIATVADIEALWSTSSALQAYRDHLSFYCSNVAIISSNGSIDVFGLAKTTSEATSTQSIASIIANIQN